LLPSVVAGLAWAAALPLFAAIDLIPSVPEPEAIWGQSLAFALAALLTWKWLILVILLLHLVNIYVYLGTHPVWPYISVTARKLLTPLFFLSFSRVDLAPVVGMAVVLLLSDMAVKPTIIQLLQKYSS